ncbi:head GIN domain-containing protein [Jejudonia soesokkakensis]|uniref:Head GIN domain-containing protein n=1 Tax=Jejudonia soesokkakensis TaxID=1323432 RepID=A0ABW2MTD2_9FLAO
MKKIILIITAFICMIGSSTVHAQWGKDKRITGDGNITTKTIETEAYDIVSTVGSMKFVLVQGAEGKITVTTDKNLQEYVKIKSGGGVLTVTLENYINYTSKHGIVITIPVQEISEASLTGSGDLIGKDTFSAKEFTTKLTGSGDITLKVNAERVYSQLTGSGDITITGSTKSFEGKVKGSGDLFATDLTSDSTDITVHGSGDAEVNATRNLKARITGSGGIIYSGKPVTKDTDVSGSGTIRSF